MTRSPLRPAAFLAALLLVALTVLPASAGTRTGSTDVSCDGTTIKNVVEVNSTALGNFSVKQNSSSPTSSTVTWATSAQSGNSLSNKTIGDNQTATWTSVKAGTYTVKARRSGNANCNGAWPGHGNYSFGYTVTFVG